MAQTTYSSLKHDIDDLRADVAAISETLRDMGADTGDGTVRRVREAIGQAGDTARRAAAGTVHQIEERPLMSVAGAFGAGVVLGTLLNRRS